jgi:Spy/CpxP family protein refolding chaperone
MRKVWTFLTAILLSAVLISPSYAFHGKGHKGYCGEYKDPVASCGLNLTADQKTKFEELRTAHLKEIKPLKDKMFSLRGDLKLLWLEKNPNQSKIIAVQKEIRALRDQMEDKRVVHQLNILKILNPEQQAKFKECCAREGFGPGPKKGTGCPGHGPGPDPDRGHLKN